ncbi:MAG: hypothetical protein Q7S30_00125 [Candidatus Omnitrophota bacterium]|nr:hypothetical protein [Candidatus Omnitrophota bacterium]
MRYAARSFILAILLMTAAFAMAAEDGAPEMKASISKKRIFVGDRIRYKVEIVSRENLEIEFPKFKDQKLGDCEIKDSGSLVKRSVFGKNTYVYWMDITSFYVGKRNVPPIEIKYKEKGEGYWRKLQTSAFAFTVETILPRDLKLTDVKDIKGVLYPFSWLRLFFWIVGASITLWIAIRLLLKSIFKKTPPKLPHEMALEEIDAASKQFAAGGEVKDYYVRISDAVRRYIESVFTLKAPEMTTQEFLRSLADSPKLKVIHKDLLRTFMEACDLVKFAKYKPTRNDIEGVFNTAKKFIEESKEIYTKKEALA